MDSMECSTSLRDESSVASVCALCGAFDNLMVCSGCRTAKYCSKEHQKSHWKVHKTCCRPKAKAKKSTHRNVTNTAPKFTQASTTLSSETSVTSSDFSPHLSNTINNENSQTGIQFLQGSYSSENSQSRNNTNSHFSEASNGNVFSVTPSQSSQKDRVAERPERDKSDDDDVADLAGDSSDPGACGKSDSVQNQTNRPKIFTYKGSSELDIFEHELDLNPQRFDLELKVSDGNMPPVTGKLSSLHPGGGPSSVHSFDRRLQLLAEYLVKCMNSYGICVIDEFLGAENIDKADAVLDETRTLHSGGALKPGQLVTSTDVSHKIRGDRITWVEGHEEGCQTIGFLVSCMDTLVMHCRQRLGQYDIVNRTKAMVACYPGSGTEYIRHVDNPNADGRCVTCIYYLNKGWDVQEKGGLLRIYPENQERVANIEPKFDRLLFFWSDRRNPHEVKPAFDTRYAITVWYFDAEERSKAKQRYLNQAADKERKNSVPLDPRQM